jgi:dinuclear metal center YbgI/SA1388 family protein
MIVNDIIEIMEKLYPLSEQESWDKCGLQIGDRNHNVNRIMIALNADNETLKQAIDNDCQMLITHHPFLLDKIETIDKNNFMGKFIFNAIKNDVAVYSAHTSLDKLSMNNWLINQLDVENVQDGDATKITKIASLKKNLTQKEFIEYVKKAYGLNHIKYAGHKDIIHTIAICGGSGADFIEEFYGKVDAYITGDSKYRHAKNADDHDILLVDIGHHAEQIMVSHLKEQLKNYVNIEIIEANCKDYYTYE